MYPISKDRGARVSGESPWHSSATKGFALVFGRLKIKCGNASAFASLTVEWATRVEP